jgi:hypothetical protein
MSIRKAYLMAYFGHGLEVAAFQMASGRFQLDLPLVLFRGHAGNRLDLLLYPAGGHVQLDPPTGRYRTFYLPHGVK